MGGNNSSLKQLKQREGHCDVPKSRKKDGVNLGRWVFNQRELEKKEKLGPDRKKMLGNIGFVWVLFERRANVPWGKNVSSLKEFEKREGHCDVPQSHKESGTALGIWVNTQRELKRMEKLDPDRQEMLEDIGFEWVLVERRANVRGALQRSSVAQRGWSQPWTVGEKTASAQKEGKARSRQAKDARGNWPRMGRKA